MKSFLIVLFCLFASMLRAAEPSADLETALPYKDTSELQLVTRLPDGKWLLGYNGYALSDPNYHQVNYILRMNADLTPDPTFTQMKLESPAGVSTSMRKLLVNDHGFYVVSAVYRLKSENNYTAVSAYNFDGTRDVSFGDEGVLEMSPDPARREYPTNAVRTKDGNLLLAILSLSSQNAAQTNLVSLTASGALNEDFADNGVFAKLPSGAVLSTYYLGSSLAALREDGSAVVAYTENGDDRIKMVSLDAHGKPDSAFGTDGILATGIRLQTDFGQLLGLADGALAVATGQKSTLQLAIYDRKGQPISKFTPTPPTTAYEKVFLYEPLVADTADAHDFAIAGRYADTDNSSPGSPIQYWDFSDQGVQNRQLELHKVGGGTPIGIFTVDKFRYIFFEASGVIKLPL